MKVFTPKLTQKYKKIARTFVSLGVLIFVLGYIYNHRDELTILFTIRWWYIVVLIVIVVLHSIISAARFASLYRALGAEMGLWESFGLSNVAGTLNAILPAQAGGVARAIYLKRQYAIPYSQLPAILLGSFLVSLFVGAVIVAFSSAIVVFIGGEVPLVLWLGTAFAGVSVALFWVTIPEWKISRLGRIGNVLHLFADGWKSIRSNKRCLIEIGIYRLFMFVLEGLGITVAYQSFGVDVHPLVGVSIVVFTSFLDIVFITPGNVGVKEALVGYLSQLSGLTFVQGVVAFALLRTVMLITRFLITPIAWYLLFFRKNIQMSVRKTTIC